MLSSVTVVLSSAVWFSFINSLSETPVTFFITLELHHSVGHYPLVATGSAPLICSRYLGIEP